MGPETRDAKIMCFESHSRRVSAARGLCTHTLGAEEGLSCPRQGVALCLAACLGTQVVSQSQVAV